MIKYTLFILLFFANSGVNLLTAQNRIKWNTWEEAVEKSKKEKKAEKIAKKNAKSSQ